MSHQPVTESSLKQELGELRERYSNLKDDALFVAWFMRAFITDKEEDAVDSLIGATNDKGIDSLFIDEQARIVFVIQGKYRHKIGVKHESRQDVLEFAELSRTLFGDNADFANFTKSIDPLFGKRLSEARERILKRKYRLHLYYVTLGKVSKGLRDEAYHLVRCASIAASLESLTAKEFFCYCATIWMASPLRYQN